VVVRSRRLLSRPRAERGHACIDL